MRKVVEGSIAVAHAVKTIKPDVIAAYPITPQTHIVEKISEYIANGELNAEYVKADSEFSAISILVGASATGARTFTSTSSQGLALMHEVLFNASGMRLPIVISVANRALSAPLNIWNDQQDSISERDSGWIQLYAEDIQEAHDLLAIAYRVSESIEIRLPSMVCMDGFILTHAYEPVDLFEESQIRDFLPDYEPEVYLTTENPLTFGALATPEFYTEFRYVLNIAMKRAEKKIVDVLSEFNEYFDRGETELIPVYGYEDGDILVISSGSLVSTIREVAENLRNNGLKIKVGKLLCFRPFPANEIRKLAEDVEKVIVFEKDISPGSEGAVFGEIKGALYHSDNRPQAYGFTVGLGGRDVPEKIVEKLIMECVNGKREEGFHFGDVKPVRETVL